MSKQSNQRYRKELEKSKNAYTDHMNTSEEDSCKDSSHTANNSSLKDNSSNLVDRYHE